MRPDIDRPATRIGAVEVYLCRIGSDSDLAVATAWTSLSDEERNRASGFRFDRDRIRWVQSMGFLRHVLGAVTGNPPAGLRFERTRGGKPFLRAGAPPFNLSHSASIAALAVSGSDAVGIDIEEPVRLPEASHDFEALAEACFLPDEVTAIRAARDPRQVFLRFWTAKEARMKLTGEGLMLEPQSIALVHEDGWPTGYVRPDSQGTRLHLFNAGSAVVALTTGPIAMHLQR